jgi:hypothetical protein
MTVEHKIAQHMSLEWVYAAATVKQQVLTCSRRASLLRISWMLVGRATLTVAVAAVDAACQALQTCRAAAMDLVSFI